MKKIGMGLVGPGFIAAHHIDAVRRLGYVDVVAIAGSNKNSAERKAKELNVDVAYGSYEELIADPRVHVVHNTTPNHMHLPVSMAAIQAGKHVISDKPLALTALFVRQGLLLTAIGVACGLVVAFVTMRLMSSLLFNVSPVDPITYITITAGVIATADLACYLPSRRAATVDPVHALRAE